MARRTSAAAPFAASNAAKWLAGLLMVAAIILTGCSDGEKTDVAEGFDPDELGHVHGMGVNPRDGALFLAAHNGVFRLGEGEDQALRVADRFQDTMGFAVVGPDHFIGSGHPDGRERLPPFIGFVESRNAARTWRPVALAGEVDFHVLEAMDSQVYGFGSNFKTRKAVLMSSTDRGRSWKRQPAPGNLVALAIDPGDADSIVVATDQRLLSSSDGGQMWTTLDSSPGLLVWPEAEAFYRIDMGGLVTKSADRGRTWSAQGQIEPEPAAFEAAQGCLLVGYHDGRVVSSTDDGRTWATFRP